MTASSSVSTVPAEGSALDGNTKGPPSARFVPKREHKRTTSTPAEESTRLNSLIARWLSSATPSARRGLRWKVRHTDFSIRGSSLGPCGLERSGFDLSGSGSVPGRLVLRDLLLDRVEFHLGQFEGPRIVFAWLAGADNRSSATAQSRSSAANLSRRFAK
jgi:hypothetical protein